MISPITPSPSPLNQVRTIFPDPKYLLPPNNLPNDFLSLSTKPDESHITMTRDQNNSISIATEDKYCTTPFSFGYRIVAKIVYMGHVC